MRLLAPLRRADHDLPLPISVELRSPGPLRNKGELSGRLFRSTGDGLPLFGKRMGPQPKEDEAADDRHDLEDHEGRHIGMKPVALDRHPDALLHFRS